MIEPGDGRLFALGLGLAFLAGSVSLHLRRRRFRARARSVEAEVVSIEQHEERGRTRYRPVFRFVTWQAETVEAHMPTSSSRPPFEEGEKIRILYDPEDPARILAPGSRVGEPVLAIAGLLFVAAAALL